MIFPLELETAAQDWLEHYAGFNKGFEPEVFDLTDGSDRPALPVHRGRVRLRRQHGVPHRRAARDARLRARRSGPGTEAKGGDDLAAFFDVIAAGHAIAYEPGAIVYHEHHRTFEALRRQTFGYGAGSPRT